MASCEHEIAMDFGFASINRYIRLHEGSGP